VPLIKTIFVFFMAGLTVIFVTPFGLAGFILSFLGLRKLMTRLMYTIAQAWGRTLIAVVGCPITVVGRENIPASGGVCFVSNHGSIFDIVLALAYIGRPFGFIAKKELLFIPLIDLWVFLLGGLFIDRAHPRSALKTITTGIKRLKAGGGMLIFPEGHRSRGEGLLPFHPGAFKLATQSGTLIVPVSISGSYDVFERTGRVDARPVRIVFGAPIITENLPPEDRKRFLAGRVKAVIEAGLGPVLN
jgi:1-acyl-sn-glycerol-3-phosphate acyltransferase